MQNTCCLLAKNNQSNARCMYFFLLYVILLLKKILCNNFVIRYFIIYIFENILCIIFAIRSFIIYIIERILYIIFVIRSFIIYIIKNILCIIFVWYYEISNQPSYSKDVYRELSGNSPDVNWHRMVIDRVGNNRVGFDQGWDWLDGNWPNTLNSHVLLLYESHVTSCLIYI